MDKDKGTPNSQPPSPLPSWLQDQALSGQWLGAVGGSELPLSETEEGAFVHVEDDWKYDTHPDLSQCADVTAWEDDVTLQELYRWEEVRVQQHSQRGARRHRELYKFEEDVRVRELSQWGDGRHPELYQREETVRCQELYEWEEDGVRYQELTRWEEHVTVQEVSQREEEETYQELSQWGDVAVPELSQWEGERYHDLPQWEEDVQGHGLYQWKDKRDPELSQVGDKTDKEQCQEEDYSAQELPQREDRSEQKLSQWGEDVGYSTWDKPWRPVNAGDPQTVPQEGPSSASSVGTEVAAEAARDLPSPAPALASATDTKPAAAAPAGAAEEEEPQGPLAPVEEEAEGSPAFGEQVPWAGTQSPVPAPHSPSEGSEALLDTKQYITCGIVKKAELVIQGSSQEPEEQRELEQTRNADMQETVRAPGSESPVSASYIPSEGSEALLDTKQYITCGIVKKAELVIEGSSQELEEQRELEQTTATEMVPLVPAERTESPVPAPQSPPDNTQDLLDMAFWLFREIMRKAERVLSCWPEDQRVPEQSTATEMKTAITAERTENPAPAPHSPSEGSKALLDTDQSITHEILSEPEAEIQGSDQEPEEERHLEQTMDTVTAVPAEREESPVPAPQSPCSPSSPSPSQVKAQALSEQQEGAGGDSALAVQDTDEGPFPGEGIGWKYYVDQDISQWEDEGDQELSQEDVNTYQEVSQWEDCIEQELSPGEVKSYQEFSDWEENIEQEQSQGEESSGQEVSDWEEYSEEEEPQGEVKSYQEVSDWEENIEQEQSQGEESRGQEVSDWEEYSEEELSHGGVKSYQEVSDWEDYSEEEQSQEVKRHKELSNWEDSSEEEQCHGKGSSSSEVTDLEECSMKGQPQRKFSNYQELLSDWEDSIAQELGHAEDSLGQDFSDWEDYTPSWLSRWEDDSDRELALADWEHTSVPSLGVKPLLLEED
ncbi:retinitis pigmentosa 1-like 1 protein, partial [Corapipo altera]|uniref:retinitis pigmentosa 1-like 1 protein n=1 Tax=Corapipo altera TaxID=415028 RepID=UPI000FD67107